MEIILKYMALVKQEKEQQQKFHLIISLNGDSL